jgi:hypothetical protein
MLRIVFNKYYLEESNKRLGKIHWYRIRNFYFLTELLLCES